MGTKLTISMSSKPALVIHRRANASKRLVYIAVGNKSRRYRFGRSRIFYIGTTRKGASRVAASAAAKAKTLLGEYGVKELQFFIVSCKRRKGMNAWRKLERGLILVFRERMGDVPIGNTQGKKMKWTNELKFFSRKRLESVLRKYGYHT